jgi:hypothetical protein
MVRVETDMKSRESAILLTLATLQFIGLVDFMIVMPLEPQLLDDLEIDAGRFSWVVSTYTLAAGLAGFVAAPWLDRLLASIAQLFRYLTGDSHGSLEKITDLPNDATHAECVEALRTQVDEAVRAGGLPPDLERHLLKVVVTIG